MRGWLLLSLIASGSLVALLGLRQFFMVPMDNAALNATWFGIQILPLLVVLPGLLRASHKSAVLAALVAMLYFVQGVWFAAAEASRTFGIAEITFALMLVTTASLLARKLQSSHQS